MKDNREIEQIFSDKLKGFEADVRPELWGNIASQIGVVSTPIAGGITLLSKVIIGAVASIVIGGIIYISNTGKDLSTESVTGQPKIAKTETKTALKKDGPEQEIMSKIADNGTVEDNVHDVLPEKESQVNDMPFIVESTQEITTVSEEEYYAPVLEPIAEEEPDVTPTPVIEELIEDEEIVETAEESAGYKITKMPDVFSPNSDGVNDIFFVKSEGLSDFNIVIMNSRNETVYQSVDTNFTWDGIGINGEEVPVGKYVYFVIAKDRNNNVVNKHSLLTVVR